MDYTDLGRRIRKARKEKKLTQDALSKEMGISLPFLGHIERGTRRASMETLVSAANALGVTTDWLLEESLEAETQTDHEYRAQRALEGIESWLRFARGEIADAREAQSK